MSTLKTTNLQESNASGANIVLGTGSGGGATISGVTTSSTLRATTGIVTTATITTADVTTSRTTTGIITTFTATNSTFAGDVDPSANGVYDIGASNLKFKQIFVNNIDASAGIVTAATFVPTIGQLSNRNIIVNGAMKIAQRATTSTSVGYKTIDRMYGNFANTDEAPTFAQVDVTADTPAWNAGFRKAFKITNGNQAGGAGAADELNMIYNVEAQDIAQSGWDYTSSSSNITLSFWIKSSVAQDFQVNMRLYPASGDQKELCFAYSATTSWTRITKVIPGAAGNVIRNTNELGMFIQMPMYYGTNYTANSRPYDTWETKNNAQNYKDFTTTWYTTEDATWEMTGLQLEVGSAATPFEHRSYGDELLRCARYYQEQQGGSDVFMYAAKAQGTTTADVGVGLVVPLRASPSVTCSTHRLFHSDGVGYTASTTAPTVVQWDANHSIHSATIALNAAGHSGITNNECCTWAPASAGLTFDSEI